MLGDDVAIRVISLSSSAERRAHMARQLEAVTVPWEFFDACTELPSDLPYDQASARWMRGRELTPGELGCFASHHALWRWLLRSDYNALCVLEDDIVFDWHFLNQLPKLAADLPGIEYLRLYAKVPRRCIDLGSIANRRLVRYELPVAGTQGYVITKDGAAKLLRSAPVVVRPVDDEMDRFWANGLPLYCIFPFPILEVAFNSTIESARRRLPKLSPLDQTRRVLFRSTEKGRRLVRRSLLPRQVQR